MPLGTIYSLDNLPTFPKGTRDTSTLYSCAVAHTAAEHWHAHRKDFWTRLYRGAMKTTKMLQRLEMVA